jgi:hypothetical protein
MQGHLGKHGYSWASRLFVLVIFAAACTPALAQPTAKPTCGKPSLPPCPSPSPSPSPSPTTPPTGCVGVNVPAGANLGTTFASYGAGTTYCLAAGTYTIVDTTDFNGVRMEQGDVVWGAGKTLTTIDAGTEIHIVGTVNGNDYSYTFRDLSIGNAGQFISPTTDCRGACGEAFTSGAVTLLHARCFGNGKSCVGGGAADTVFDDVECDGNGWHPRELNSSAACVKQNRGDLTVRNSNIHDNPGVGLWADFCDDCHWLIEDNTIVNNGTMGISWEVSGFFVAGDNAVVRRNIIQNNGWNSWDGKSGGVAGIAVNDGTNIEVYSNTFGGNKYWTSSGGNLCCRGFVIYNGTRQPGDLFGVNFHDNTMNGDIYGDCSLAGVTCSNNV